jgi:hypothetical protein
VNTQRETLLTGWTNSKYFPTTAGAFQTQAGSSADSFAVKLRPDGTIAYASYLQNFAADIPSSRYAIDFRIPDAPGQGVYFVPVPGVLTRAEIGRVGSGLGVYVQ